MTKIRSSERPLRIDAARNQALIIDAAREVFMKRGLDVPLDDIAHHAGVGVATLYRRFPSRESLIVTMFEARIRDTVELARTALAAEDPWEGFVTLLSTIFRVVAEDKGLRQLLLSSRYGLNEASSGRDELVGLLERVVERAREDGRLRAGIAATDIPIQMLMIGVVADFSIDADPDLWQRYATLLIDGMAARPDAPELAPAAFSEDQMARAMARW